MILKAGKDIKKPTNYRPIALLNTMGKLLEALLLDNLKISLIPKIRKEHKKKNKVSDYTIALRNS